MVSLLKYSVYKNGQTRKKIRVHTGVKNLIENINTTRKTSKE